MIFRSAAVRTLDQATAVLDELKLTYQPQIEAGTLTDFDRERIRQRLQFATELEERSRSESSFSLLGELVAAGERFFKTGRWGIINEQYMQELLTLRQRAEAQRTATRDGQLIGALRAPVAAEASGDVMRLCRVDT